MRTNRHRHQNSIHVAALARWIVIAAFLGVSGLSYVYLKIQLIETGNSKRQGEEELRELADKNRVLRSQIATMTSRPYLERKLGEGFINLVPIAPDMIVRVNSAPRGIDSGIRTAANETSSR